MAVLLLASCGDEATPTTSYTVLDVEAWVGKVIDETDLAQYLDVATLPDDGIWILWRDCCEPCAELIRHVETLDGGEQPLVLVQIPDRGFCGNRQRILGLPTGEHVIRVTLPDDREWLVTVPAVLVLRGRRVIYAAQGVLVDTYIHVPAWAKIATEQIAEAKKRGVPVAFENDIGMRFVLIPAGTFLMGSPEDEEGRFDDETQHEVTITKPYYLQIAEVAVSEYEEMPRAVEDASYDSRRPSLQHPACVFFTHARDFAVWLSEETDRTYRIPSEAEWEHACRAGTTTTYNTGVTISTQQANFDMVVRAKRRNLSLPSLTDVGLYAPNHWGLYDMHGNACEWCLDQYAPYEGSPQIDPAGPMSPNLDRVWRGGSHFEEAARVRSARRGHALEKPHPRRPMAYPVGFRLVSPLPEKER